MRSLYHQPGVGTVLVARDAAWAWHVYQAAPDATRLIRDCPAVWHVPVHADRAVSVDRELYFHCSGTQQWQRGDTGVLCSATELPVGTAAVADPAAVACPGVSLRRVANEALEAVETATGHGVVAVPPSRAQWLCATSTEKIGRAHV